MSRFCNTHIKERTGVEVWDFINRNQGKGELGRRNQIRGYVELLRRRNVMRGMLLVVEGPEFVGKTTLIRGLEALLRGREPGVRVRAFREPGGTELGERIRATLNGNSGKVEICSEAEALLFAASRAQLCRKVRELVKSGEVVVLDRFVLSTKLYQGEGRGLGGVVEVISEFATGGLKPDLEVILLASEKGLAGRSAGRVLDRLESDVDFQAKVKAGYRRFAEEVRTDRRYLVVDTDGMGEEEVLMVVYDRVLEELAVRG